MVRGGPHLKHALLLLSVLIGFTAAAHAQDAVSAARAQLVTALYTSDRAQDGRALSTAHRYLRQMINCLEGPHGTHYAAAAGNPCQRQGNGILVDLGAVAAGNPRMGKALRFAVAAHVFALQGLASADLEEAQTYARMSAFDIGNALEALD